MSKVTKIIVWLIGLSFLFYFIFLSLEINREKPKEISPIETTTPFVLPEESTISTSTEY